MDLSGVLILLAAILHGILRGSEAGEHNSRNAKDELSKKIYCGRHLSQTLSTVCRGNYNTLIKRPEVYDKNYWVAQYTSDMQNDAATAVAEAVAEYYPFKSKASAQSLMTSGGYRGRKKRGVYNECCEKPCSHEELASYCGSRK